VTAFEVDQHGRHGYAPNEAGDCVRCVDAPQDHPARSSALDRLRGLAIACMVVDHVALIFAGPQLLRETIGRLAVPLFFIVGGHLVRRLSWRHGWVLLVGLALPALIPWVDAPNVLVHYAIGAALLVAMRAGRLSPWLLVALALTAMANETMPAGNGYNPVALYALMAVGAVIGRHSFVFGERLPRFLGLVGRFPLSVYVGHLFLFEIVRVSL
jgi:uncharacterized membrane protein YcfT